jgi:hypothetical protein
MLGADSLSTPGRIRYHADHSIQIKCYDNEENFFEKAAFSLTGDLGCEHGGGVSCVGNSAKGPKQAFLGTSRSAGSSITAPLAYPISPAPAA